MFQKPNLKTLCSNNEKVFQVTLKVQNPNLLLEDLHIINKL
jgi:hypothetical protein